MLGLGKRMGIARTLSLPDWGTAQFRALCAATGGIKEGRRKNAEFRMKSSAAHGHSRRIAKCTTDGSREIRINEN